MKRFRDMEQLPFVRYPLLPHVPFFVMDEVDAALDNSDIFYIVISL